MKSWGEKKGITGVQLKTEHKEKARVCKSCGIKKAWIYKKSCGMNKLYVDENGKMWNSAICRDCHNKKYGTDYQKKRAVRAVSRKLRREAKARFNSRIDIDSDFE